jgi:threonine/homoserine/homoserine lactone efflux protein
VDYLPIILSVTVLWALALISPGQNFVIVSRYALSHSWRAAAGATIGITMGSQLYGLLTLFGLSVVISHLAWAGVFARVAGGVYLIWLGIQMWRHAASPLPGGVSAAAGDFSAGFRTGFISALSNPKGIAFFLGLFATAFTRDTPVWVQLTVLGNGAVLSLLWYGTVAATLSTGPLRSGYRRIKTGLDRAFGTLFILFGGKLATSQS